MKVKVFYLSRVNQTVKLNTVCTPMAAQGHIPEWGIFFMRKINIKDIWKFVQIFIIIYDNNNKQFTDHTGSLNAELKMLFPKHV